MSDAYIGEIRMFAGNFAPVGWAQCNGQLLSIAQNTALFSVLGTTYGGDGKTNFALPDLRSRVPVHVGPGFSLGQAGGAESAVKVVELKDGSTVNMGGIRIKAAENSHYDTLGVASANRPISLSYRFDVFGRSVVYTGDTGPSAKVAGLCQGADLLVSEIMDPELAIARLKILRPNAPSRLTQIVEDHFRREHLSPDEVGKLANACGVKRVVLTHNSLERHEMGGARDKIAARFNGEIVFAEDLQSF